MKLSEKAKEEFIKLAESDEFKKDMEKIASQRHNPFFKNGEVGIDAYIEFVQQFNEFINHESKPFKPMIDGDMKL